MNPNYKLTLEMALIYIYNKILCNTLGPTEFEARRLEAEALSDFPELWPGSSLGIGTGLFWV